MKTIIFSILTLISGLMVLASLHACQKEGAAQMFGEPVKAEKSMMAANGNVEAINGWLRFPTLKTFEATMQQLHKFDLEGVRNWEAGLKGFTSLRHQYELIDADTSEKRTQPTVDSLIVSNKLLDCPDSRFATVLSKTGYIQIADTIYSFLPGQAKGEAYAVPARHAGELLKGAKAPTLDGSKLHHTSFIRIPLPRWTVGDIQRGPLKIPICIYPSSPMLNWWGQNGGDIYSGDDNITFPEHNGRQVKLNYQRWRVGYIFYASAGIRCKMWKHTRFAGWQSVTYADEMIMEACCKGNVVTPGLPLQPFSEQTSPAWPGFVHYAENNFEKTMIWTASGLLNDIFLDHFNFHFKVNYRGHIVERNIRQ